MHADVDAAVAAKLLLLFPPQPEVFLSFPLSGAAFSRAELDIFDVGGGPVEDVNTKALNKALFARVLNRVMEDSVVMSSTDRMLWDEYARVLEQAEVATSTLTAAEHIKLAEARDVLTDVATEDAGQAVIYSPALKSYYQYKDAYETVERMRLDEKVTASVTGEDAGWLAGRGAELAAGAERAMQDWVNLGHKDAIEQAQAVVASLTGRSPELRRRELLDTFEACQEVTLPDTDPDGVLSTFFSPRDCFAPDQPWAELHLTSAEIAALLEQAPPEIRARAGASAEDILDITVEYADVAVMRPWFDPGFFSSTSWRLPADDPDPVSDGKIPRAGRIPAYITSMVVARKVTVVRSGPAYAAPSVDAAAPATMLNRARLATTSFRDGRAAAPDSVRDHRTAAAVTIRDHRTGVVVDTPRRRTGVTIRTSSPKDRNAWVLALQLGSAVRGLPTTEQLRMVRDHRRPRPPWTSSTEVIDIDGALVLAYRCRRLPESPRPDASLDWSGTGDVPTPAPDWPLPAGHTFGAATGDPVVHNGRGSQADKAAVTHLQSRLKQQGHELQADGAFGPITARAVTSFQTASGTPADGRVDRATWTALWSQNAISIAAGGAKSG